MFNIAEDEMVIAYLQSEKHKLESIYLTNDFSQMVYAIRQDMTVTKSNQAVITDAEGKVIMNLYQQDMTALRFVLRLGWQLPRPVNAVGGENPFPFAVLNKA
jgi:hypothetical protein